VPDPAASEPVSADRVPPAGGGSLERRPQPLDALPARVAALEVAVCELRNELKAANHRSVAVLPEGRARATLSQHVDEANKRLDELVV
jgi:hypothetical protein